MSTTHGKQSRLAKWVAARSKRFWITAALTLATAYPLSLGPFLRLSDRGYIPGPVQAVLQPIYAPLSLAWVFPPVERTMNWYMGLWSEDVDFAELPEGTVFQVDIAPDGRKGISYVTP